MNQFWVDPEGVSRQAQPYADVQSQLDAIREDATPLASEYQSSFGDESECKRFFQNFSDWHDQFLEGIKQKSQEAQYFGDGLQQNGKDYAGARDDADQLTNRFAEAGQQRDAEPNQQPNAEPNQQRDAEAPAAEDEHPRTADGQQLDEPRESLVAEHAQPGGGSEDRHEVQPAQDPPPQVGGGSEDRREVQPAQDPPPQPGQEHQLSHLVGGPVPKADGGYLVDDAKHSEVEVRHGEMVSSMMMPRVRPGEQPMVQGKPLASDEHVLTANELPGGAVRLGVDGYSKVTPLNGKDVTLGDPGDPAQARDYPVDKGQQLFLVKEKPGGQNPSQNPADHLYMEFPGGDRQATFFREGSR